MNPLKYELQNILSGKDQDSQGNPIQTIARHLGAGPSTGPMAQGSQQDKHKETERSVGYAKQHKLWVEGPELSDLISTGAGQRIFIKDEKHFYKLNDSIYYAPWKDYFHNLLLNVYFT